MTAAVAIRARPLADFVPQAAAIVDSDLVIHTYAALEWDELHEDGQQWAAAIVRETFARAAEEADRDQVATDGAGSKRAMRPIPIGAAKRIAVSYGYDQVVIVGRRVGYEPAPCGEHVTTFGVDPIHCSVAARCGEALRWFMGWPLDPADKLRARILKLEDQLASATAGKTYHG